MKIDYSKHALKRLVRRGLSKQEIQDALIKGQDRESQHHGTIKCVYKKGGNAVVVVYIQNKDYYKIITAYRK